MQTDTEISPASHTAPPPISASLLAKEHTAEGKGGRSYTLTDKDGGQDGGQTR